MQITEDPAALVSGADMLRWFIALLAAYVLVAFCMGIRARNVYFWRIPGRLALLGALLWLILDVGLSYLVIFDRPSDIPAESYALSVTFGMPWEWDLPGLFLPAATGGVPIWLHIGCTVAAASILLFLLALLPYSFGRVLFRSLRPVKP